MHIVLGATGHIGSAVVEELASLHEPVLAIAHSSRNTERLRSLRAEVATVDANDATALREVFKRGRRLFLLNPPANPRVDTEIEERKTLRSILTALQESGLEKIVAESTYGARAGTGIGDLGILHEMEQALDAQPIPATIIRAAYYMSNWDQAAGSAAKEGILPTFFPEFFKLPMVAAADIGRAAARLLLEAPEVSGIHYVEGPERYSPAEVAVAFGTAFGRSVKVAVTPREEWEQTLRRMEFSEPAAKAFCAMTDLAMNTAYPDLDHVTRGATSIERYAEALATRQK